MIGEVAAKVAHALRAQLVERRFDQGDILLPDGNTSGFEDVGVARLALAQPLFRQPAICDVFHGAVYTRYAAGLFIPHRAPVIAQPPRLAVAADDPLLAHVF